MHVTIHNLLVREIDKFICQETDIYGHSTPDPSDSRVVDLRIDIRTIAVDDKRIILEFPNDAILIVHISSNSYASIEVF